MTSLTGQPALPMYSAGFGISTPYATLLPPGSKVAAYVRGTNGTLLQQSNDDPFLAKNLVATLNEGCKRVRSGAGDTIIVLPGHTENFAVADSVPDLLAGTRIISAGRPGASNNPTFTWTATASTLLLNVADVTLQGCNLNFAGIDAVVAAITVSAAGCALLGNHITLAAGSAGVTTAITVAAGANNCLIAGNKMLQTGTQTEVNIISITGAVDNLEIAHNTISCLLTSATGGVIQVGEAATNLSIHDNRIYNAVEDGVGIRIADTFAATGMIYNNFFRGIDAGGTVANTLKVVSFEGTTESLLGCYQNFSTDEATTSGILSPAAVAN